MKMAVLKDLFLGFNILANKYQNKMLYKDFAAKMKQKQPYVIPKQQEFNDNLQPQPSLRPEQEGIENVNVHGKNQAFFEADQSRQNWQQFNSNKQLDQAAEQKFSQFSYNSEAFNYSDESQSMRGKNMDIYSQKHFQANPHNYQNPGTDELVDDPFEYPQKKKLIANGLYSRLTTFQAQQKQKGSFFNQYFPQPQSLGAKNPPKIAPKGTKIKQKNEAQNKIIANQVVFNPEITIDVKTLQSGAPAFTLTEGRQLSESFRRGFVRKLISQLSYNPPTRSKQIIRNAAHQIQVHLYILKVWIESYKLIFIIEKFIAEKGRPLNDDEKKILIENQLIKYLKKNNDEKRYKVYKIVNCIFQVLGIAENKTNQWVDDLIKRHLNGQLENFNDNDGNNEVSGHRNGRSRKKPKKPESDPFSEPVNINVYAYPFSLRNKVAAKIGNNLRQAFEQILRQTSNQFSISYNDAKAIFKLQGEVTILKQPQKHTNQFGNNRKTNYEGQFMAPPIEFIPDNSSFNSHNYFSHPARLQAEPVLSYKSSRSDKKNARNSKNQKKKPFQPEVSKQDSFLNLDSILLEFLRVNPGCEVKKLQDQNQKWMKKLNFTPDMMKEVRAVRFSMLLKRNQFTIRDQLVIPISQNNNSSIKMQQGRSKGTKISKGTENCNFIFDQSDESQQ